MDQIAYKFFIAEYEKYVHGLYNIDHRNCESLTRILFTEFSLWNDLLQVLKEHEPRHLQFLVLEFDAYNAK